MKVIVEEISKKLGLFEERGGDGVDLKTISFGDKLESSWVNPGLTESNPKVNKTNQSEMKEFGRE